MRKFFIVIGVLIFIFSCFMFLTVGLGGGSASCITSPDYCSKVDFYKWSAMIMGIASLLGTLGMSNSSSNFDDQKFSIFGIVGILIPVLIYFFLGQFVGSI